MPDEKSKGLLPQEGNLQPGSQTAQAAWRAKRAPGWQGSPVQSRLPGSTCHLPAQNPRTPSQQPHHTPPAPDLWLVSPALTHQDSGAQRGPQSAWGSVEGKSGPPWGLGPHCGPPKGNRGDGGRTPWEGAVTEQELGTERSAGSLGRALPPNSLGRMPKVCAQGRAGRGHQQAGQECRRGPLLSLFRPLRRSPPA